MTLTKSEEETIANISYATEWECRGNEGLTIFPVIDNQTEKRVFTLHDIITATKVIKGTRIGKWEQMTEADKKKLYRAALCLQTIQMEGYKYKVSKMQVPDDANTKTILLLGKTGCGKSTMGNILTGSDEFEVSDDTMSVTKNTQIARNEERKVVVLDTKGFFDNEQMSEFKLLGPHEQKMKLAEEIKNLFHSIEKTGGIDCVALVMKKARFDLSDVLLVQCALKNLFKDDLGDRLFIVVTHADNTCEDPEAELEWVKKNTGKDKPFNSYFDLVKRDNSRVVFVDNKDPNGCKKYVIISYYLYYSLL